MVFLEKLSLELNRWVEHLLFLMGFAMAFVVALQVFFRYVLNASLFWSEELARHLLVWLTFLGASAAHYRGRHPGINTLVNRLPLSWKRAAAIMGHILALGLFAVMVWYGIKFAWFVRAQETPALHLPRWMVFSALPAGALILLVHSAAFLLRTLREPHDR